MRPRWLLFGERYQSLAAFPRAYALALLQSAATRSTCLRAAIQHRVEVRGPSAARECREASLRPGTAGVDWYVGLEGLPRSMRIIVIYVMKLC